MHTASLASTPGRSSRASVRSATRPSSSSSTASAAIVTFSGCASRMNLNQTYCWVRLDRDFLCVRQFFLPPLPSTSNSPPLALQPVRSYRNDGGGGPTLQERARRQLYDRPTHPRFRYSDWKTRNRPAEMPQVDQEDLALEKRRYVYKHSLFVKHVASNRYTRVSEHRKWQPLCV